MKLSQIQIERPAAFAAGVRALRSHEPAGLADRLDR